VGEGDEERGNRSSGALHTSGAQNENSGGHRGHTRRESGNEEEGVKGALAEVTRSVTNRVGGPGPCKGGPDGHIQGDHDC